VVVDETASRSTGCRSRSHSMLDSVNDWMAVLTLNSAVIVINYFCY